MHRRVVITGLGVVAPNGIGKQAYWDAVVSGRSGIGPITRFDVTGYRTTIAGEIRCFEPTAYMSRKQARRLSRCARFALAAAQMAVEDGNFEVTEESTYRTGVAFGTAIGGIEVVEELCKVCREKGPGEINPLTVFAANSNSTVGAVATRLGIRGPNICVSSGCSAGLMAIGYAFDAIRSGKVEAMVTGGTDSPLSASTFGSFDRTHGLSERNDDPERASRPFDKMRDGYILGEGAGALVLEEYEHARSRGAEIYAELKGYAVTNDAYDPARVEPTGRIAARTMSQALDEAHVARDDVDYVNAHGSSSRITDRKETVAIKMALGERARRVFISSIKSMIGQPLAASGPIQLVTAALAIRHHCLPPTINYEYPDPECDLDYVPNEARRESVRIALINCFGMGGSNVSMVVGKPNGNGSGRGARAPDRKGGMRETWIPDTRYAVPTG